MNTNFAYFVKELILNPAAVFEKNIKGITQHPRYFSILIAIYGIGSMAEQLQQQFIQYDAKGNLEMLKLLNNWEALWGASIIFGFLGGLISYYIGGWFFNIRLRLAKGDSNIQTSRNIFLYSRFVFVIATLAISLIKTFLQPIPYYPNAGFTSWDLAFFLISLTFMYHSCYIGYVGVRTLSNADKQKSILWFITLPMSLYVFALVSLFSLMVG